MDGNHRVKIKIGPHEFEAEGSAQVVQAQFEAFKELVATTPIPTTQPFSPGREASDEIVPPKRDLATTDSALDKIMKVDHRIVSFTVPPTSLGDALLLLLYGQKILRQNEAVSGAEIVDGLKTTGGLGGGRTDRLLDKAARDGDVIAIGQRRAKRYRLTNTGLAKARQLAADLIAKVA